MTGQERSNLIKLASFGYLFLFRDMILLSFRCFGFQLLSTSANDKNCNAKTAAGYQVADSWPAHKSRPPFLNLEWDLRREGS